MLKLEGQSTLAECGTAGDCLQVAQLSPERWIYGEIILFSIVFVILVPLPCKEYVIMGIRTCN